MFGSVTGVRWGAAEIRGGTDRKGSQGSGVNNGLRRHSKQERSNSEACGRPEVTLNDFSLSSI